MTTRNLTTPLGLLLGASTALFVTSEYARRSKSYWYVSDLVSNRVLRRLDPETAHTMTIYGLRAKLNPLAPVLEEENAKALRTSVWGLNFNNPVGVAAGFDKQAAALESCFEMGFGFVEVGGVTPEPQGGNPKPRLFRLVEDEAIVNRFGLNSDGHHLVAKRLLLRNRKLTTPTFVNLAKNTATPGAGVDDYVKGVRTLGPLCDGVVLNVSCPNVPAGVKVGEDNDDLKDLVTRVKRERDVSCPEIPFLIKMGPDMNDFSLSKIAKISIECGVDGLVVSNTTAERGDDLGLVSSMKSEKGGLSGKPLKEKAMRTLRELYLRTNGAIPIIAVGGISSPQEAYDRIRNGASLVQIYSGLVYKGPSLLPTIQRELAEMLRRDGFINVAEAVGADLKGQFISNSPGVNGLSSSRIK